ncbi:MAG: 4Fe-4S dicluster domain-containing protein [Chloroflexi bacterium]|nr:4Fe-4S dicluster domain-containing protein [Chloroflexota bacterium]
MADKAILYDAARCTACRGCQAACKQWNMNDEGEGEKTTNRGSYENPADLSPRTWLKMEFREIERNGKVRFLFNRRACLHCTDAACVKVCPTKALSRHELGFITYDRSMCSGCQYCIDACPFQVPRFTRNALTGVAVMDKCTLCTSNGLDRLAAGYEPACVKACPPRALAYGDREQLAAEGRKRVQALQAKGYNNAYLYGDKELSGLHVLYVLDESPDFYGMPLNPVVPPASIAWKDVIQPLGWGVGGLTLVGLGLNYVVARANAKKEE